MRVRGVGESDVGVRGVEGGCCVSCHMYVLLTPIKSSCPFRLCGPQFTAIQCFIATLQLQRAREREGERKRERGREEEESKHRAQPQQRCAGTPSLPGYPNSSGNHITATHSSCAPAHPSNPIPLTPLTSSCPCTAQAAAGQPGVSRLR